MKTVMFHHPHRPKVHRRWGIDKQGRPKIEYIDDRGGVGPQIMHECNACPDCSLIQEAKKKQTHEAEQLRFMK